MAFAIVANYHPSTQCRPLFSPHPFCFPIAIPDICCFQWRCIIDTISVIAVISVFLTCRHDAQLCAPAKHGQTHAPFYFSASISSVISVNVSPEMHSLSSDAMCSSLQSQMPYRSDPRDHDRFYPYYVKLHYSLCASGMYGISHSHNLWKVSHFSFKPSAGFRIPSASTRSTSFRKRPDHLIDFFRLLRGHRHTLTIFHQEWHALIFHPGTFGIRNFSFSPRCNVVIIFRSESNAISCILGKLSSISLSADLFHIKQGKFVVGSIRSYGQMHHCRVSSRKYLFFCGWDSLFADFSICITSCHSHTVLRQCSVLSEHTTLTQPNVSTLGSLFTIVLTFTTMCDTESAKVPS